jgi:hypothetical protein
MIKECSTGLAGELERSKNEALGLYLAQRKRKVLFAVFGDCKQGLFRRISAAGAIYLWYKLFY